ncbi:MAG: SPASM domain-containing protein [Desulfobacterales bacterium]
MTRGMPGRHRILFTPPMLRWVRPCGFLDLNCGDVTRQSFAEIWTSSEIFNNLRNYKNLKGKCGACEYSGLRQVPGPGL